LRRPAVAAFVGFALHLPFVLRYDLNFVPDFAISVAMSRAIAFEGERPLFFWGQSYLGTYGCWVTALLFRVFGVSVPLAALVPLVVWALGVALATALAARILGPRGAWWAGLAGAVASPYANHYIAQPYSSYETAAVLGVLALAAAPLVVRLLERPLDGRAVLAWLGIGTVLGFGWWTTRLFVPLGVAAALAVALCVRWRMPVWRRGAAGAALVLAAALAGASPELFHAPPARARIGETPSLALAPPAMTLANAREALRTLPAYLNGDPRARAAEGATWSQDVVRPVGGQAPPAPSGTLARAYDGAVLAATIALLVLAGAALPRALAARDAGRVALCLAPFVHLALLVASAQTAGAYYNARRYWFASLLVVPLLLANAIVVLETWRPRAGRVGRAVAGALLLASAGTQAWMLTLPDELGDYRALTRQLDAGGERVVWMSGWNAWLVAALSTTGIEPVTRHYDRRPGTYRRAAAADRIAVVQVAPDPFPLVVDVMGTKFHPAPGPPRPAGALSWHQYRRGATTHGG
jgi:hypothetical protein